MKPPPFAYHNPNTLAEAVSLLASLENAKVLAGGQSLMPMLNMRYAMPDHLVDLNDVAELSGIELRGDALYIGAMTRQRDLELAPIVKERCPLLAEALANVGHVQTRNRGTFGGSLCHLDPASELPAVAMTLDATILVQGKGGKRELPMAKFPLTFMTPAIEPDEIVAGALLPLWPKGHGWAFLEFARRHGDFAVVGVAALLALKSNGRIERAAITICGVGPAPLRLTDAERSLAGALPGEDAFRAAAESAGKIDAIEDVHASKSYRQHLALTLTERALNAAGQRAARRI
ncbi:MAG: xanthine dehydrogenase family protein subunit M [Betaproteobacteria bacterium]|nr:xanthine dehydrogenase family protein subunit M [Betaproteobacteria bacterium]